MNDLLEKAIKGLELCKQDGNYCYDKQCPYEKNFPKCVQSLLSDALELLKAQEPVEPVELVDQYYPIGDPLRTIGWRCGICGERIAGYDNYCPNCGKAVEWDG